MENLKKQILVVDDDLAILDCIRMSLQKDFTCKITVCSNSQEALELLESDIFNVVISDIAMPNLSGFQLLEYINKLNPNIPVILITGESDPDKIRSAVHLGAFDILHKPFELSDLHISVKQALQKNSLLLQNEMYRLNLEGLVEKRTQELYAAQNQLEKNYLNTIHAMVNVLEANDVYIRGHSERVTVLSIMLGKMIGLDSEDLKLIRYGAILHDLGKIGIDYTVLNKTEPLTSSEYDLIKQHPVIGANIISPIGFPAPVNEIIIQHHEWYNGTGYPYGLASEHISPLARIVTIADAYDAMTSQRAYRQYLEPPTARQEVMNKAGTQFDPEYSKIFYHYYPQIIEPVSDSPSIQNLLFDLK
jgi:putative nucleotidyltransferase with HDIG domain